MPVIDDLIKEFLVESYENLDQLDRDFVALEGNPSAKEKLSSIFRTIHTIKGNCGCLGFPKLESVAHVGENLLSRLRDGDLMMDSEITTGLLKLADTIRGILKTIEMAGNEGEREYSEIIQMLSSLNEARQSTSELIPKAVLPGTMPPAIETPVTEAAIKEHIESAVNNNEHRSADRQNDSLSGNAIRVDVNLLDKLMNLVGELVLARNQVIQYTSNQKEVSLLRAAQRLNLITTELQEGVMKTRMQPIGSLWNKFPRIVRDVSNLCHKKVRFEMEGRDTELDKTIIEAIKDPLTHVIRNSIDHGVERPEVRAAAGKPEEGRLFMRAFHEGGQVNIEVSDDGKGIDSEIIKRKAIEKGLITPDQAARMSEREAIHLIFAPGFSTAETITNVSGRGVGMDVVKTNVEKIGGTVDVQSTLGQGTTLRIKIPLTLAIIPALVVSSGDERFAIPQVSLLELVRIEPDDQKVERINRTPFYRLRGALLPLVYLNSELQLATSNNPTEGANIVVLRGGERNFGLVVDQINDTEEIVVKPLAKQLKKLTVFAGATIMGDGRVALILDVLGLAHRAKILSNGGEVSKTIASSQSAVGEDCRQMILLFKLKNSHRMAIPLSTVSRLEELPRNRIEWVGNQMVIQYRGQIMPLVDIASCVELREESIARDTSDASASESVQIVVHVHDGRYFGLLVEQILDVTEEALNMQQTGAGGAVLGTAIIKNRVTEILDIDAIVRPLAKIDIALEGARA